MNVKKPFQCPQDQRPVFLHEVQVSSTGKVYTLTPGTQVSVIRKPGLIAGRYEFCYAERDKHGQLLIQVEGPVSRQRRRRIIRESDIKVVHLKTRRRD